ATNMVRRFASDPRWAGEPFRRMIDGVVQQLPRPVAADLLGRCESHVSSEPDGLGWLAEAFARIGETGRAGQLLEAAVHRPTATCDAWCRLALLHGPESVMKRAATTLRPQDYLALCAVVVETQTGKNWTPELTDPRSRR